MTHPELAQAPTAAPATGWSFSRSRVAIIQTITLAALLVVAYWTPLRQIELRWRTDPDWSHGYLVPVFSLYFLWTRRHAIASATVRPSYFGAVVLLASLAMYFAGSWWLRMTYPQTVSIVGSIFGLVLLMGGWSVTRLVWFPIAYLLFAIPLPYSYWVALTQPLQVLSTSASAVILPVLLPGLYADAQSVVIDYVYNGRSGHLNVEEACSGLRLMMTFMALGTAMAWLDERPTWQRVLMVMSCLPIAVFCNFVRVTVTGVFSITGNDSLATGTPHMLLGIAMVGLAFALFALFGKILRGLFVEEEIESGDVEAAAQSRG